jgi:nitrous oxide reductase accessory protein NosL
MRIAVLPMAALLVAVVAGCTSTTPVPIRAGDVCEYCGQAIQDVKIAAEIAPPAGKLALKFRTVSCMAKYLKEHGTVAGDMYVTDYDTGRLIMARSAVFVKGVIDNNTMEKDYYAFGDVKSAVAYTKKNGGSVIDWPGVRQTVTAASAD